MPVLIIVLALLALFWVKPLAVGIWAGAVIVTHLAVVLVCRQFLNAEKVEFEARRRTTTFIIVESIYGLAWASLAISPFMSLSRMCLLSNGQY